MNCDRCWGGSFRGRQHERGLKEVREHMGRYCQVEELDY